MMQIITLVIEDGRQPKAEATAFSKESANINVSAGSWAQALELLAQGKGLASEACKNWKQEAPEEPGQDQTHSKENMKKVAQAYEESTQGKRFIKAIEQAKEFTFKRYSGLMTSQLSYLADKYRNNLVNGSFDLMALAYKQGYTDGRKAARK